MSSFKLNSNNFGPESLQSRNLNHSSKEIHEENMKGVSTLEDIENPKLFQNIDKAQRGKRTTSQENIEIRDKPLPKAGQRYVMLNSCFTQSLASDEPDMVIPNF